MSYVLYGWFPELSIGFLEGASPDSRKVIREGDNGDAFFVIRSGDATWLYRYTLVEKGCQVALRQFGFWVESRVLWFC